MFSIDDADDYGDATSASIVYANNESPSKSPPKHSDSPVKRSKLRVQTWNIAELEKAYEGRVVRRKDIDSIESTNVPIGSESPDQDAINDWSEGEPFETIEPHAASDSDSDPDHVVSNASLFAAINDQTELRKKAQHVRNQNQIWERCLETQIQIKHLQKRIDSLAQASEISVKEKCIAKLYACISVIQSLEDKLSSWDQSTQDRVSDTPSALWNVLSKSCNESLIGYNDILSACTKQFSLVQVKKSSAKFKSVNQDILSQVNAVVSDTQRVKRKAHPLMHDSDQLDDSVYDDTEFYQQLLKEFIDQSAQSGNAGFQNALERRKRRKRANAHQKTSKGRQIRYVVHPKLENFMFPEPYAHTNMDIDGLYQSLFGQTNVVKA